MAKKKKRTRPRTPSGAQTPPRGGANLERRDRKEEARRFREAERRRARRTAALRRTFTSIGIAVLAVGGITIFQSLGGPNDIPPAAIRAAEQAGCTEVVQPAASAPGGQHLSPGASYDYPDTPATSGFHDPSPLPERPKVYDTPVPETRAVHSLEHGAVFVYYLPEADGGISQQILDRLVQVARGDRATFVAPYPTLESSKAVTFTAWNRRQSCGVSEDLTPATAATILNGFVTAFECTGNAPEPRNSPC
jgi:uncharacterized protein DUF3105